MSLRFIPVYSPLIPPLFTMFFSLKIQALQLIFQFNYKSRPRALARAGFHSGGDENAFSLFHYPTFVFRSISFNKTFPLGLHPRTFLKQFFYRLSILDLQQITRQKRPNFGAFAICAFDPLLRSDNRCWILFSVVSELNINLMKCSLLAKLLCSFKGLLGA